MSKAETALKNFELARNELLERLRLRDQVLIVHMGFVGAVLGVALGTTAHYEVLMVIPFVALAMAFMHGHHHCHLGALTHFCAMEIAPFLGKLGQNAPMFDNSETLYHIAVAATKRRSIGTTILFGVPCLISLTVNWRHAIFFSLPLTLVWWLGAVCTVLAVHEIVRALRFRDALFKTYIWHKREKVPGKNARAKKVQVSRGGWLKYRAKK